jgi:hypothetical protein
MPAASAVKPLYRASNRLPGRCPETRCWLQRSSPSRRSLVKVSLRWRDERKVPQQPGNRQRTVYSLKILCTPGPLLPPAYRRRAGPAPVIPVSKTSVRFRAVGANHTRANTANRSAECSAGRRSVTWYMSASNASVPHSELTRILIGAGKSRTNQRVIGDSQ